MKKFLIAAVASTAFVSAPALAAPSDSDDFTINASVAQACTMQGINDINLGNIAVTLAAGADALLISGNSQQQTTQFWVSCNDTNSMELQAAPAMVNQTRSLQSGDDAGFTDTINYRVGALGYLDGIGGSGPRFVSASGNYFNNGTARGAVHRQIQMQATVLRNENPLRPLAGTYTANVVVTVSTT